MSVEKLTWPLILVCCVFGFYQFCINGGKCSQWNFFSTMNHSEVAKVQMVMFSLLGREFNSKVRCALVLVQAGCYL